MKSNFSFSYALDMLKARNIVARDGWNGKGMYLVYFSPVAHGMKLLKVLDCEEGTEYPLLHFILMKTVDNMYVPWVASQTDILANDWYIVN